MRPHTFFLRTFCGLIDGCAVSTRGRLVSAVVDITRAWGGSETTLVSRVLRDLAPAGEPVTIICFERQQPAIAPVANGATLVTIPDNSLLNDVGAAVFDATKSLASDAASQVTVY